MQYKKAYADIYLLPILYLIKSTKLNILWCKYVLTEMGRIYISPNIFWQHYFHEICCLAIRKTNSAKNIETFLLKCFAIMVYSAGPFSRARIQILRSGY